MTGEEVRSAPRDELMAHDRVKAAVEEAEAQLRRYGQDLEERHGDALRLRAWTVVSLGFDRLVTRPLHIPTII